MQTATNFELSIVTARPFSPQEGARPNYIGVSILCQFKETYVRIGYLSMMFSLGSSNIMLTLVLLQYWRRSQAMVFVIPVYLIVRVALYISLLLRQIFL